MSLGTQVAAQLPYLRRYARALTGSQSAGDAFVRATLEAALSDHSLQLSLSGGRVPLYHAFTKMWSRACLDIADPRPASGAPEGAAQAKLAAITPILDKIKVAPENLLAQTKTHQTLLTVSDVYQDVMTDLLHAMNIMPPSGAMAGVYARTDSSFGVFKAPANTGITGAMSPTVNISHDDQEDLNVPLEGKAINAIRTFVGRGVLVWGARTLDGNSQDWRYINVRRTLIMLEQSISLAAQAYVFAANDAGTWLTMRTMIENFLNNQWKSGALVGAKPEDAYEVSVGLGSTMTGNDILDGIMRVMVKVAIVHPAEFIIITFQQKMQTS